MKSFYTSKKRYRSVRYRVGCSQSTVETGDLPEYILKNERSCKKSLQQINISIKKISSPLNEQDNFNNQSSTCVQTFEAIMKSNVIDKSKRQQYKHQHRVSLPLIVEYDNSKFTALDPIILPIEFIQSQIDKLSKQINAQKEIVKGVRQEIKNFQSNLLPKIEQIQKQGLLAFQKLNRVLAANKINQQQIVLKHKAGIQQASSYIPTYKTHFDEAHKRVLKLQQIIYSTKPFELQQQQQYSILSGKYF